MSISLEDMDFGDQVDTATFEQILDMDDGEEDDSHEFSKSIVFGFFEQAETTFDKMDAALKKKDLDELSALGHFLKGSSATLGFTMIKNECEKIQNYGHRKDGTGLNDLDDEKECLRLIAISKAEAQDAFHTVEKLMRHYYARLENE